MFFNSYKRAWNTRLGHKMLKIKHLIWTSIKYMNNVRMIPKVMHTMHALSTPLACATDVTSLFSLIYFNKVSCIYFSGQNHLNLVMKLLWVDYSTGLKGVHQNWNFTWLYTSKNLWNVARSVFQHNFTLVPKVSQGQDSVEDQ